VFHVAITRGRQRVHIVPDSHPSPFIAQCFNPPEPNARPSVSAAAIRSVGPKQTTAPLAAADASLFEQLRVVRRELAAGKPAYTVVSDQVLRDIASVRPTSLAALANIKGMGPVKLERYGDELLAVVEAAAG
jgi:DNA helicase II / ATP-dependent DNA helicase PcrA